MLQEAERLLPIIGIALLALILLIVLIAVLLVRRHKRKKRMTRQAAVLPIVSVPGSGENPETEGIEPLPDTEPASPAGWDCPAFSLQSAQGGLHMGKLTEAGVIVGRAPGPGGLTIDYDRGISKQHCRIFAHGPRVMVEDLGAMNRTYHNGVAVAPTVPVLIRTGDTLLLGKTTFTLTLH
ncbi:FHA domain-containing protein [Ruminococcaceae bacterium OttesenSCG-928-L11]|nr:FHA domain-containing protein [Ruminococcaceae bacterium OttesenSCG-928-L11]